MAVDLRRIDKNCWVSFTFWVRNRLKWSYGDGFFAFGLFPIKSAPDASILHY